LIEFIRRDLRWCQATCQYWHFLLLPGPQAREPLPACIRNPDVLGSPAWIGLLVVGTAALAFAGSPAAFIHADAAALCSRSCSHVVRNPRSRP